MSEIILKALMKLFALLTKQDGGVEEKEREYVKIFLERRLNPEMVDEYLQLFDEQAYDKRKKSDKKKLTSVRDSVKILGLCKKINKTLSQKQKVIVLIHLYELIVSDRKFTEQRMAIINTVADVFNISAEEDKAIEVFTKSEDGSELLSQEGILAIHNGKNKVNDSDKEIIATNLQGPVFILKVESVDLYILKYSGCESLMLNSQYLNPTEVLLFSHGSILRLPKDKPVYYNDVIAHFNKDKIDTKLSFNVNNISYTFDSGFVGLKDISLSEQQGSLIGIMGSSGSGKTTLLNVLSGIETPSKGEVLINGINLHEDKDKIKGIIGYIPQDDILIEEITVFENLFFNAKFCFKDLSDEEITEKVNKTLKNLGLYEKKDLKVGSPITNKTISGGQRKRLNIALELIREPTILFVDEPTSGLSSRDSENIMDLLRELAMSGKLIFTVIHQPSSDIYKMFEKVLILDTGGYLICYDNPIEAVRYFKKVDMQIDKDGGYCTSCGNVNPEIIFNIIEKRVVDEYGHYGNSRKVTPKVWGNLFKENYDLKKHDDIKEELPSVFNVPNKFQQFKNYLKRDVFSKLSNKQYIIINLLISPLLAFILAFIVRYNYDVNSDYIYRLNDNIFPYIFIAVIVPLLVGMTVSAEEIFKDRKILKRESFLNLSRTSYLIAKILIMFFIAAVQSFLFVVIGNSIMGIKGMYFDYWLILFSINCVAVMIGLNISSAFNSVVTIYILIPLIIIPQLILGGATFDFAKLNRFIGGGQENPPLITEIIPARWGFEALVVHQYINNKYERRLYDINQMISVCNYKASFLVPTLLNVLDDYENNYNRHRLLDSIEYTMPNDDIELLANEISKEMFKGESRNHLEFEKLDSLNNMVFSMNICRSARSYLNEVRDFYNNAYNAAVSNRDARISEMQSTPEKRTEYINTRNAYFNESLADLVRNTAAKNKILRSGNELVQNMDKVYQYPSGTGVLDLRAHFYAPYKNFFGVLISTFWKNAIVLWTMSILFYLTLHFQVLKRLLNWSPKKKNKVVVERNE